MNFEKAIEVVLRHEGGYVNHPSDPGGETNFGITKRSYPDLDIKALTKEQAVEIYRADFWDKYQIEELPDAVRLQVFDMAVNMGYGNAAKTVQRCSTRIGMDTAIDGVIGPKTLESLRKVASITLSAEISIQRVKYYCALVRRNPEMRVFFLGWIERAVSVR